MDDIGRNDHLGGRAAVSTGGTTSIKAGIAATLLVFLCFVSIPLLSSITMAPDSYGLSSNKPAPQFQLTDTSGHDVTLSNYRGKYVFLMFGFLGCTDICHSQALLFQEINQLADNPEEIEFLFITMDPERDTAKRLNAYFNGRGDNFTALRDDSVAVIKKIAADYRAYFAHDGNPADSGKDIRHGGFYFLIDPEGQIRRTYTASHKEAAMVVDDLKALEQRS